MAWWAALASLIPLVVDYLSDDQYTGEEKFALDELKKRSKGGYSKEVMEMMKRNISQSMGQETSAQSTRLQQELTRSRTPHAPKTAAMESLVSAMGGARAQAMSNVDIQSEQSKMDALRTLTGGLSYIKPDTGLSELSGSLMGNVMNYYLLQNMLGGQQGQDINTQKLLMSGYGRNSSQSPQIGSFSRNRDPNWFTNYTRY